jgi:hypothetical protein
MELDRKIERAEELLSGACSAISEAVSAHDVLSDGGARYKRQLADALVRVWEAREVLYSARPELRPASMPNPDSL